MEVFLMDTIKINSEQATVPLTSIETDMTLEGVS